VTRLDVDTPSAACSFDVKAFSEHADLAPRVPFWRDKHLVSIDDVVLERLLFEQ